MEFTIVNCDFELRLCSKQIDVKMKKIDIYNYIVVKQCVKDVKYIYCVKKDLFGWFTIEENVKKTMKQV